MIIPSFPTHKQVSRAILRWYYERPPFWRFYRFFRWMKEGAFFES